jgi:hypothetical protein
MRVTLILLLVALAATLGAQPTPAPSAPQAGPRPSSPVLDETQLFQVVLLRGSRRGTDDTDGLPRSAAKALADLRDFLPFKHYQLLDSAIVRMAYGMNGEVSMTPYQVKFSYERKNDKISIWLFTVLPAKKIEQPMPPAASAQSRQTPYAPEAVKPLISTSFQMEKGETVVVGSSKINGDEALVVLLTALPGR